MWPYGKALALVAKTALGPFVSEGNHVVARGLRWKRRARWYVQTLQGTTMTCKLELRSEHSQMTHVLVNAKSNLSTIM